MKSDNSFLRDPVDTESRLQLLLPCKIVFPDHELQVVTFNISYSGIGVELPSNASDFDARSLKSISVPDIGDFDVFVRWKRGLKMGLSFLSKRSARSTLDTYFRKSGSYPF